jgi:hypothetical protein
MTSEPFYQNHFIQIHLFFILPPVRRIEFYSVSLSFVIRIDQCDRNKVILYVDTPVIAQRQGIVNCGVRYGPPKVDNLETLFDKPLRFSSR